MTDADDIRTETGRADPGAPEEATREVSLDEAVSIAVRFLQLQQAAGADRLLRAVLAVAPDHPAALHYAGVLACQDGRSEAGLALIGRSLEADPSNADWHSNLGIALKSAGRREDALAAYGRAIALDPGHAKAHNNMGVLLSALGRVAEAEASYREALRLAPDYIEAHSNLATLLWDQGRVPDALAAFNRALVLSPPTPETRQRRARAYCALGEPEQAVRVYDEWLRDEPDNPSVQYLRAACSGEAVPQRAPDAYIERVFNGAAAGFDGNLAHLRYRAPQAVVAALGGAGVQADGQLDVLDAGCGTGLCGPLLRPYAGRLVGVDLSGRMLAQAETRKVYDELCQAELTGYLAAHPASFDVIVSADTLVYFGALHDVAAAAAAALRPAGRLIFTAEAAADERESPGYALQFSGRYAHTRAYLAYVLTQAGFEVEIAEASLRTEGGLPVAGFVVRATARPSGAAREVTLHEAISIAVLFLQNQQTSEATRVLRDVLAVAPAHPAALHFAGVAACQDKRFDEGIGLINRSLEADPSNADWHSNLGIALKGAGRDEEAMAAYGRAIALEPGHARAHNNLGVLQRRKGRFAAAEASYREAIRLKPDYAEAHQNLGVLLSGVGRVPEAVEALNRALVLTPAAPETRRLLAYAHCALGEPGKAVQIYQDWLREEPDNPVARHLLAACSGEAVPARAADAFVERVFDSFAESFDAKLASLSYRAPQIVAASLADSGMEAAGALDVLDAGCGTGLCGPLLRPYARRLVGVDLSGEMLARAGTRQVYDDLIRAELTGYLAAHPGAFDVVASADTLVYFGALEEVAAVAAAALRPGGLLVFTVEASVGLEPPAGYELHFHGRYVHGRAYLAGVLARAGFRAEIASAELRMESGLPVAGYVVRATRPAGAGGPQDGADDA